MYLERFQSEILPLKEKLFRFAYSLVRSREEAEDAVQEVLLRVWSKREEWNTWKNIEAYCMKATRNAAVERLRQPRAVSVVAASSVGPDPGRAVEVKQAMERLRQAIGELSESQQMVLQLREGEGMSYVEIAAFLGMSMDQVKVTLFRARAGLRRRLTDDDIIWTS